ncbi:AraC-like ligand-binding domain-containing protein [Micromonospora thermarum]|uniref:Transcription regulator HTH AraC- type ligand binding domain-containing protein n=1 Tax=Micromonospora thermarum TaxID=2720024 RepID=A0ABX0Z7W7_9ACTN|nr:hypothetical protein [Micromonospora thermarum]NJP33917.1 hypothetical protein [Micromonospora thermarum]
MTALPVETLDTTLVSPADRFPLWLAMSDDVSAPISFTSEHAHDFRGRARLVGLGDIAVTRFRYQSLVGRTSRLIRQGDPGVYQIALPYAGSRAISARRRDPAIPNGDFTLIDWGRQHDLSHIIGAEGQEPAAHLDAEEETVAQSIRRRRLERCRHDLLAPLLRQLPVHQVARRWGSPTRPTSAVPSAPRTA